MSLATLYGETQDTYLTLIRTCPLRPLRSEADLDEAMALLDALVVQDTLSTAEADYLAVLSDLVEQYEAAVHPIPPPPMRKYSSICWRRSPRPCSRWSRPQGSTRRRSKRSSPGPSP